jgi:receptor protein-tyrosine kinase
MSKITEVWRRLESDGPAVGGDGIPQGMAQAIRPGNTSRLLAGERDDAGLSTCEKTLHIDRQVLREAGLLAPDHDARRLAAQYRRIKRPLIRHAFGRRATKVEDGNLIMITSAVAGEGKTFTSINLAMSMANEQDHSVILVDADVAKPHVSEIFGLSEERGLLDLIEDRSLSISSLVVSTDIEGLYVLPAGRPWPNATELLASQRMEQLTKALSTISREPIVLFDSPPLLQTSESSVLASLAGQIVIVVRAGYTSHDSLKLAVKAIGADRAVSLVLNQLRDVNDAVFGYGYAGGYTARDKEDYSEQESRYPGRATG